jgi:hypothetical protein
LRRSYDGLEASMKFCVGALLVVVTLFSPRVAAAGLMELPLTHSGLSFGTFGAQFREGFYDIFIDGVPQFLSGFVEFTSIGPPSVTVDDSNSDTVRSHYAFGPGTFTLSVHWFDQFGAFTQGQYVAPLLDLEVDITCEGELSILDCGSWGPDSSHGRVSILVGSGVFDRSLATALGVRRSGDAFGFSWFMDAIEGSPSSPARFGEGLEETVEIGVTEVPEPSVLSLLLTSPLVALQFRRTSARRRVSVKCSS